jgi:hypothetical protein
MTSRSFQLPLQEAVGKDSNSLNSTEPWPPAKTGNQPAPAWGSPCVSCRSH